MPDGKKQSEFTAATTLDGADVSGVQGSGADTERKFNVSLWDNRFAGLSHTTDTANPHSVTAAQAGAAPLSHVGQGGGAHVNATTVTAGFMSPADKTKSDAIDPAAQVPAGGTAGQGLTKVDGTNYNMVWSDPAQPGTGGHVIQDLAGAGLPQQAALQFADSLGDMTATDDAGNSRTVINLSAKASKSVVDAHVANSVIHVVQGDKDNWNALIPHPADTNNPHSVTATQVGLGSVVDGAEPNRALASQAEAEAGTDNIKGMTALRTAQAIEELGGGSGDVVGPASAVDERVAVFDSTTGKLIKDGGVTIAEISGGGGADHGSLTGLDGDDHAHYHTDARGDARYYTQTEVDDLLASVSGTAAMPSSISAGGFAEVVVTVTGAAAATHAVTFLHIPSTNAKLGRYGVVTATNEVTVTLTNNDTSTISGLTGNITVKAEAI